MTAHIVSLISARRLILRCSERALLLSYVILARCDGVHHTTIGTTPLYTLAHTPRARGNIPCSVLRARRARGLGWSSAREARLPLDRPGRGATLCAYAGRCDGLTLL